MNDSEVPIIGGAPDEEAVSDGLRTRTRESLLTRMELIAALCRDLGAADGGHLAILTGNRVEYAELMLGAMCAGTWVTPVNRHLTSDEVGNT